MSNKVPVKKTPLTQPTLLSKYDNYIARSGLILFNKWVESPVTDCEEGVCVDPRERDAILGTGGPGPPGKGEGQQLVPDSGGGEK
jgi:hypothetical protein